MTRVQGASVAVGFALLFSLALAGCDGGGDDGAPGPDVRGVYQGTATQTYSGSLDPAKNDASTSNVTVDISRQNGADFSGTLQDADGNTANIAGQLSANGATSGTITFAARDSGFQATFNRTLTDNVLTADDSVQFTAG